TTQKSAVLRSVSISRAKLVNFSSGSAATVFVVVAGCADVGDAPANAAGATLSAEVARSATAAVAVVARFASTVLRCMNPPLPGAPTGSGARGRTTVVGRPQPSGARAAGTRSIHGQVRVISRSTCRPRSTLARVNGGDYISPQPPRNSP